MPDNITLQEFTASSGTYTAGTIMATKQNADDSHSQRVVVDRVLENGVIDEGNTTTAPLGAGGVFTGTPSSTIEYGTIIISVYANASSATDGVEFQFSSDGVNFKTADVYTYRDGGACKVWAVQTVGPFFRIKYTNGAVAQTQFDMCVQLKKNAGVTSSHRVADDISGQDDAALTKTILMAERAGGTPDVYTNINATAGGNLKVAVDEWPENDPVSTTRADDAYNDAFQRLRVSSPDTRFDVNFKYDKQPLIFDEIISGAGTATHNAAARDVTLAVGNATAGSRAGLCQHWYNVYTPGNSQFIILTGALNGAALSGGTVEYFLRSSVTGSVVEQTGTISAAMMNPAFSQIFIIDFQSLDVGRIRFALDRDGLVMPLGEINNDNRRATAYWQSPSLPICFDTFNTATESVTEFRYGDEANAVGFRYRRPLNAAHTARAICATVKSEGGGGLLDLDGFPFAAANGATTKTVSTTLIPLLSAQLKTTFSSLPNRGLVLPQAYSITTDQPLYYEICINPTLTNANFASVDAQSLCNFDTAATAVTGGRVISSGYIGAGGQRAGGQEKGITSKIPLSVNYAGDVGDIITIAAVRVGPTNASAGVSLEWREIR